MHIRKPYANRANQAGFTLIEVLVSIIILSFGLLGIAGLQAASLKLSRESQFQSTGVLLAREYAELMRNNNSVAEKTTATNNPYLIASTATVPTSPGKQCLSAACTASDVAQWDRDDWLMRVAKVLPGAKVEVCFDSEPFTISGTDKGLAKAWGNCSNTGSTIMIKIGWTQTSGETTSSGSNTTYKGTIQTASAPAIVLPIAPGGPFGPSAVASSSGSGT